MAQEAKYSLVVACSTADFKAVSALGRLGGEVNLAFLWWACPRT